ncbi:major facilitator superfamily domain-containing protein [Pelagophyceae sp. CCMP2097]|nr:major facilitator superfamily domain-containing protein [Pelagophyceae sp. CCMP2097]
MNFFDLNVYVNMILYATCYQLQRPVEPFLVKQLGADDAAYGRLQSWFSLLNAVGAPIVGAALDAFGARAMFMVVFASSAASYFMLSRATTLSWLFASKIPTLLQAGFLVAQALVASHHARGPAADRAAALGRLTTAYTIGATIGPAVGGVLGANGDYYYGARLAVYGSLASVALAAMLPTHQADKVAKVLDKADSPPAGKWASACSLASRKAVFPILLVKCLSGVANSALGTAMPLQLRDAGFDEKWMGFSMSAQAFFVAFGAAFAIGPLVHACGAKDLLRLALLGKALVVAAMALALFFGRGLALALTVLNVLDACASHVLATTLTTLSTGAVLPAEQGLLIGLEHFVFSAARVVGPSLGIEIVQRASFSILAALCAGFNALLLAYVAQALPPQQQTETLQGETKMK